MIALQIWWLGIESQADAIAKKKLLLGQNLAFLVEDCQTFRKDGSEQAILAILARARKPEPPVGEILERLLLLLNTTECDCEVAMKDMTDQAVLAILATNMELRQSVEGLVEELTEESLIILSLLTWHFDAKIGGPPSPGIFHFFAQPNEQLDAVCENIHTSYTMEVGPISLGGFRKRFVELLVLMEFYVTKGKYSLV